MQDGRYVLMTLRLLDREFRDALPRRRLWEIRWLEAVAGTEPNNPYTIA